MPSIEEFEQCRENNYETYRFFLLNFVACVAGREQFKKNCYQKNISELISVSDEAVTMLILKNNYAVWEEIGINNKNGHAGNKLKECIENQKYFLEGKGRGRSWNNEGKKYYNDMYKKLMEDRKEHGEEFDNKLLNSLLEEKGGQRRRKNNNNKKQSDEDDIKCYADVDMS